MPSRVWTTFSPPWVGVPDLLTAATARLGDLTVLHYDHDFDLIHEVTGQPMAWVVDAGSVD